MTSNFSAIQPIVKHYADFTRELYTYSYYEQGMSNNNICVCKWKMEHKHHFMPSHKYNSYKYFNDHKYSAVQLFNGTHKKSCRSVNMQRIASDSPLQSSNGTN